MSPLNSLFFLFLILFDVIWWERTWGELRVCHKQILMSSGLHVSLFFFFRHLKKFRLIVLLFLLLYPSSKGWFFVTVITHRQIDLRLPVLFPTLFIDAWSHMKIFFLLSLTWSSCHIRQGIEWENNLDRKGCKKILFHCIPSSLISIFMLSNRMSGDVNARNKIPRKIHLGVCLSAKPLLLRDAAHPSLNCKSLRISLLFSFLSFQN